MRLLIITVIAIFSLIKDAPATQILSKSIIEKCEKVSESGGLNCSSKIVLDLSVPSESSGREASLVAEVVEAEENSTNHMRTLRVPPVITINKSAAYAVYELSYIQDAAYKPQELFVQTRKCEPDAGSHVVQIFDKVINGKANTAHCLRFTDDWFHVFGIGQRSVGFTVRVEVKTGSRTSEVIVGPENRAAISSDNFLRVNLVGDYVGYTSIPSFDDFYLVIPRQGEQGQPQTMGNNFSMWMLLERVRFTLDGLECNKIGVGYEAFNAQPDFCAAPFWSCLHNQLWNFWDADQNRINRNQVPLYRVEGRFERINEHPNSGSHEFSIGITEALNTNILLELRADDIEFVYQRSPGKILGIAIPTFEALSQFGTATITTKNIGEVEASYSLTFDCFSGISQMEEQFFIMKPKEVIIRSFKLYPTTDQAARYACAAILKDSDFKEIDRAECQFTTTATVIENGSQIPFQPPQTSINGFFESIEETWNKLWEGLQDFITGRSCRHYLSHHSIRKCSGFFDFICHVQYICISWMLTFGLFLAIFPTAAVLLWLLHQKGLFDPLYDWWEDHVCASEDASVNIWKHDRNVDFSLVHLKKHHRHEERHHKHSAQKRRHIPGERRHRSLTVPSDYHYHLHHVQKDKHKHGRHKSSGISGEAHRSRREDGVARNNRRRKKDNPYPSP
ncbi:protein HAPLESS 2 [Dorcoceras hygrometricum]|uniref:Protein HAPLESS 2 n=1 Tax=Dorcoceras hygrometricum TaxID=472368 RepID=A0A2Z7CHC8_9LAMI|nr:protein HAPLESS 2 [Dorcoceras hygrometricum]